MHLKPSKTKKTLAFIVFFFFCDCIYFTWFPFQLSKFLACCRNTWHSKITFLSSSEMMLEISSPGKLKVVNRVFQVKADRHSWPVQLSNKWSLFAHVMLFDIYWYQWWEQVHLETWVIIFQCPCLHQKQLINFHLARMMICVQTASVESTMHHVIIKAVFWRKHYFMTVCSQKQRCNESVSHKKTYSN